jgi:hypothetical protein
MFKSVRITACHIQVQLAGYLLLLLLLLLLLYVSAMKIRNATLTPHVNTNSCCGYRDSKAYL